MEVRGVWITTTASQVLNSKANIAEAIDFLAETGFNVVFPVVWARGVTIYKSKVMQERFGIEIDPRYAERDPLAELIVEARRVGLAVIPWFEYGFASSYKANGGHLLAKKPEWAASDSAGNKLQKNDFFWMNGLDFQVQDFLLNLVLEVVKNYDIDGIQGDDRLPAFPSEGGYDSKTVAAFRQQFNSDPPQNPKERQWLQWRADILTDFLTRLYFEAIAIKPDLAISMSPSHYPWGLVEYLQDAQAWIDRGLVDLVHPQLYRRDFESYKLLVDRLANQQFTTEQLPILAPGILLKESSYTISSEYLLQAIAYNRSRGIQGEVFFFYEGLRENSDALASVLRSGPYAQRVPFNLKEVKSRGFTSLRLSEPDRYIDRTGKVLLEVRFDAADSFKEGLARVKMGYKWGYIDQSGKLPIRFQFDDAESFCEGLARVRIAYKFGYIDFTGKLVISLQFDGAESFSSGLAAVKIENKWGYIDRTGESVISLQFDAAESFSFGLAAVKIENKWGYIDKTGKLTIAPQFDSAGAFEGGDRAIPGTGLAAVKIGNKWGYIDQTGQLAIALQFDEAKSFSSGMAAVKIDNKWGYIDQIGKLAIPLLFEDAKSFSSEFGAVKFNNKWGFINKKVSG